jgi:hypothetical protein
MFTKPRSVAFCGGCVLLLILAAATSISAIPPAPVFGVDADIVDLSPYGVVPGPYGVPNRGLLIRRVFRNTPAAHMGLERGDILIAIDSVRFTTMAGVRQALRCAGDRPSLVLLDVRSGRLIRRTAWFPHRQPDPVFCEPSPPDSYYMSIDLVPDLQ